MKSFSFFHFSKLTSRFFFFFSRGWLKARATTVTTRVERAWTPTISSFSSKSFLLILHSTSFKCLQIDNDLTTHEPLPLKTFKNKIIIIGGSIFLRLSYKFGALPAVPLAQPENWDRRADDITHNRHGGGGYDWQSTATVIVTHKKERKKNDNSHDLIFIVPPPLEKKNHFFLLLQEIR